MGARRFMAVLPHTQHADGLVAEGRAIRIADGLKYREALAEASVGFAQFLRPGVNEAASVERARHQIKRRVERGRGFRRLKLFSSLRQGPVFGEPLRQLESYEGLLLDRPAGARRGQSFFQRLYRVSVSSAREQDATEDSLRSRVDRLAVTSERFFDGLLRREQVALQQFQLSQVGQGYRFSLCKLVFAGEPQPVFHQFLDR